MSHEQALKHNALLDIGAQPGLRELLDRSDANSNESGGSQLSDGGGGGDEALWSPNK